MSQTSKPQVHHLGEAHLKDRSQTQTIQTCRYGSSGALAALTCAVSLRPPCIVFPVADLNTCASLPARPGGGAPSGGTGPAPKSGGSGSRVNTGLLGSGLDAKARAAEGGSTSVLRDALVLRPGSTSEDLFLVLKKPPYGMLEGDFVRAECRAISVQAGPRPSPTVGIAAVQKSDSQHGHVLSSAMHGLSLRGCEEVSSSGGLSQEEQNCKEHSDESSPQTGHVQSWRMVKKDEVLSFKSCVIKVMTNRKSRWQHAHNQTAEAV